MAKRGPKPHKPTDEQRKLVEQLSGRGLPHKMIVSLIDGVSHEETLRTHYREELDRGAAKACAQVAGKLFEKCMSGDTASILFWMKTRCGFRENMSEDSSLEAESATDTLKRIAELLPK